MSRKLNLPQRTVSGSRINVYSRTNRQLRISVDARTTSWPKVFLYRLFARYKGNPAPSAAESDTLNALDPEPTALEEPPLENPSPDRFVGPYRLQGKIGRGGMGVVWRAEDTRLGRTVALKVLPAELAREPKSKARFLQEARATSALDHPNVCSIYEVGETADLQLYLVMPCYEGETLDDRLERGSMTVSEVLDIASQIARGLGKAHQKGIVHRDVKPSNLMVTGDGILKILDFGVAKLVSGTFHLTQSGSAVGTPSYMSPEQMQAKAVDQRTDLWSLGVVIYEMLAGRHPFPGENALAIREAILHAEPEPLRRLRPDVPAKLDRLVAALLQKDPAARMPSAESVETALRSMTGGTPWWRPAQLLPRTPTARRLGSVLLLLGLVATGIFSLPRLRRLVEPGLRASTAPAAPSASAPSDRRRSVAVLGFRNLSGDASQHSQQWLGPALTEMLTAELGAGAKFRVVSSERMALAHQSLNPSEKKGLEPASLERLHALVGADFAVNGTYLPLGGRDDRRLRLDIRILTLPEGDTVTSVVEAGTEAELFDLVTRAGSRLRNALGFSMPTAAERLQARGLVPAGSEAIRLYAEALSRLRSFDPVGARNLLQRAEALEPDSVAIQSALAGTWTMLGQDVRAREAALKAFEARGSLPQEAQLAVEARFYETVKDWARASETYRSLGTLFPDELDYDLRLAETLSMGGQDHEALAVINKMHERPSPDGEDPRIDVTETIVAMRHADYSRMKKAAEVAVTKGQRLGLWLITARGRIYQAHLALLKGHPREAFGLLNQAKELALRAGDRWTVGQVEANLGLVLQQEGDLDGAEQVQQRALVTARELGSALGISSQLLSLGQIQRDRGNLKEARALLEEALDWSRRIDYRRWQGYTQVKLGTVHLSQGDPEGARHWLADALALSELIGNARNEVEALQALAELEALEGKIEEALRLQETALQALLELRIPSLAAGTLASSADLLARTGDLPLARRRLLQAEAAGQHAADRLLSGHLLGVRARFAFRAGNLSAARTASESQLQLARESGARLLEAAALRGFARTARAAGDLRGARDLLQEASLISSASGDELTGAAILLDLARLDLDQADPESALKRANEAAAWHRTRQFPGGEATALAILAEAELRMGRPGEARESSARARAVIPQADLELRLAITPALARVEAATGAPGSALRTLGQAATEAQRMGFVPAAIEARLAQGEILMARGEADAARAVLQPMHQQARQKGFLLAAQRAAKLLSRTTPAAMH